MPLTVEERTPSAPVDVGRLAQQLRDEARGADNGHAAITLTPGRDREFTQTVVALRSGARLSPDHWNGPATLQVLEGVVTIEGIDDDVAGGQWAAVPAPDAAIEAREDAVVLLTAAASGEDEAERERGHQAETADPGDPSVGDREHDELGPKDSDPSTMSDMGLGGPSS